MELLNNPSSLGHNDFNIFRFSPIKLFTVEDGRMGRGVALENRYGQRDHSMRALGIIIVLMVKEDSSMLMEMLTLENGNLIELMVLECIIITMEGLMKGNGTMIFRMDTERRFGLMEQNTKVSLRVERRKAREISSGQMERITRVIF